MKNTKITYFLSTVKFWPTFNIQLSIALEQLQNYTLKNAYRSLSKHANVQINKATHYEITALEKNETFVSFLVVFYSK